MSFCQRVSFETLRPGVACVKIAVAISDQSQIYVIPPDFQNRQQPAEITLSVLRINP